MYRAVWKAVYRALNLHMSIGLGPLHIRIVACRQHVGKSLTNSIDYLDGDVLGKEREGYSNSEGIQGREGLLG